MENIQQSQPTMHNSWGLTVTSMANKFGKRKMKANTNLVQSKILTADNLMARQWPCNPVCSLCNQEQETATHLVLHCNFAKLVWEKNGGLDATTSLSTRKWVGNCPLVAKGAPTIAKEDKETKSWDDDLLCLEPMEGKE